MGAGSRVGDRQTATVAVPGKISVVVQGPVGAPVYKGEPKPSWWSPWRRWLRTALALAPLILGIAALGFLIQIALFAQFSAPAFAGAIVGALMATFGNMLVQYLMALIQERRTNGDRIRREIGIAALLMAELGEALVRMRVNAALMRNGSPDALAHLEEAVTSTWDGVKLDAAQLWMPKSIFAVSETYTTIRLANHEIGSRTPRIRERDFIEAVEQVVQKIAATVKMLERRQLRVGRE